MKKKKRGPRHDRSSNFKHQPSTGKDIGELKYDEKPSRIMKVSTQNKENHADQELRKLVTKKGVWPSSPGAINKGQTNKRRNK